MEDLRKKLAEFNLAPLETEGDGNCFFRAVSTMVYDDDSHHSMVRLQAVNRIKSHPQDYEQFILGGEYESLEAYLQSMSQDRVWADNTIIRATADALEVEINIISDNNNNYVPNFSPQNPSQTLFLGHIAGLHYVSTSSKDEIEQLRYGGFTSDGVSLSNTSSIDTCLTWFFNVVSRCDELRKNMSASKDKNFFKLISVWKEFLNGNSANSKRAWYLHITKQKTEASRPRNYNNEK